MQKIFYNARLFTLAEDFEEQAFLINDDAIVFVGKTEEVLQMKNDNVELVDVNNSIIMPTFFDINIDVYSMIQNNLKNAKKEKFIEKERQKDENYEIFCNFDIYAQEFENIQNELLKRGITTIHEEIQSVQEFVFWKKISESGRLKIDVIGFVDILKNKQIMDDNCRTFRKYKNHFRLGGYYINLDNSILEKKAWLKKSYPRERGYAGYASIGYEQLIYIIKTALDEKKQMLIHADGDMAVEQFLNCYQEYSKKNKIDDNFRPLIFGCNFVNKKMLKIMKDLHITPVIDIENITFNERRLKEIFGCFRYKKLVPISILEKYNLPYLLYTKKDKISEIIFNEKILVNNLFNKLHGKGFKFDRNKALKKLILDTSYFAFDNEQKGSLEIGKKANFLVFDNNEEDIINQIYLEGKLIFDIKKK